MSAVAETIVRIESRHFWFACCLLLLPSLLSCSPESGGAVTGPVQCQPSHPESDIVLATYNIHAGVGRDGKRDFSRIVEVLDDVDVVGIQEVDNGRIRSGFDNQARRLAVALRHRYWQHFPAEEYWPFGTYGNAATSAVPVTASGLFDLPLVEGKPLRRLAWIKLLVDCRPMHVFVLHLTRSEDQSSPDQFAQAQAVWRAMLNATSGAVEPIALLGDFNAGHDSPTVRWFRGRLIDVVENSPQNQSVPSIPDHVFVSRDLTVIKLEIRDHGGSDHPAIVVGVRWK